MANDVEASSPRYRWLLRLTVAYAAIALMLAIVTFAWWQRGVRIRDQIYAGLRAAGAPASVAEMNALLDARSSTAAADAGRRIAAFTPTNWLRPATQPLAPIEEARLEATSRWETDHDARVPATPADVVQLRVIVSADAAALAMFDTVLDGRPIDWGVRYRSPLIMTLLPYLTAARNAGKLLAQSATLAHADGDDALAIRRLTEAMTLADSTAQPPTPLVGVLSGTSIVREQISATIESIAATIRVEDGPLAVHRADLNALIARLLDGGPSHDALHASLEYERLGVPLDAIENQSPSPRGPSPFGLAIGRPILRQTYDGPSAQIDAALRALDAPTLPAAEAMALPDRTMGREVARVPRRALVLRDLPMPSLHRTAVNFHQQATLRRAYATLLAIRLFEIDHGRVPTTLDELVPAYLPGVPTDEVGDTRRPLWYVNERGVIAIYVPGQNRNGVKNSPPASRPTTVSLDLRSGRQRNDVIVVYRGHALVKR